MIAFLTFLIFVFVFSAVQGIVYMMHKTTPAEEAKKKINKIKNSDVITRLVLEKQLKLKRLGAGILLKNQMTVSQWYLYKGIMAALFALIAMFISKGVIKSDSYKIISLGFAIVGWLFLDLMLMLQNKTSNSEMLPDICEMSRSVLYGKRGGQYIADALRDAVVVVENKRLKMALMRLRNDLDSGIPLSNCLDELEMSFSNGEISSFCTVIKSLQTTGQVDEALKTLEGNIEREQVSVNKRRCMSLEQKTMLYVILIAIDLLAIILYCIIMKLLAMELGF